MGNSTWQPSLISHRVDFWRHLSRQRVGERENSSDAYSGGLEPIGETFVE